MTNLPLPHKSFWPALACAITLLVLVMPLLGMLGLAGDASAVRPWLP